MEVVGKWCVVWWSSFLYKWPKPDGSEGLLVVICEVVVVETSSAMGGFCWVVFIGTSRAEI